MFGLLCCCLFSVQSTSVSREWIWARSVLGLASNLYSSVQRRPLARSGLTSSTSPKCSVIYNSDLKLKVTIIAHELSHHPSGSSACEFTLTCCVSSCGHLCKQATHHLSVFHRVIHGHICLFSCVFFISQDCWVVKTTYCSWPFFSVSYTSKSWHFLDQFLVEEL